ncbi:hypothetical protein [Nonomuraea sp. NPDC002799]
MTTPTPGDSGYTNPPSDTTGNGQSDETAPVQFRPPAEGGTEEAALSVAPMTASGVTGDMLAARAEIAAVIRRNISPEPGAMSIRDFSNEGNLQGVAIGLGTGAGQGTPGEPVVTVYVAEPAAPDRVRSMLVESMGIQAVSDVPLEVVTSGVFDAQPHRAKLRPAPGGFSIGHFRVTAGTLGCLATGRTAPRNERLLCLSNNHVIANVNNASYGDCICQPGIYDGGTCPADQIAILERFVPLKMGGPPNYVDCATGWCWPDRVRPEIGYLDSDRVKLFRIGNQIATPTLGMAVGKSGRTTQLTSGQITGINWSGNVNYGSVGQAYFENQLLIQSNFSAGGDSGSCIWTWDAARNPVGLLFAGGGNFTIANPMSQVVAALDINLVTGG